MLRGKYCRVSYSFRGRSEAEELADMIPIGEAMTRASINSDDGMKRVSEPQRTLSYGFGVGREARR